MTREQWAKMTDEQKRIKVAESCGWKCYNDNGMGWKVEHQSGVPMFQHLSLSHAVAHLPDYLNDLNAMHEAEKLLWEDAEKLNLYWLLLREVTHCSNPPSGCVGVVPIAAMTTARQRAEAFVLTMEAPQG